MIATVMTKERIQEHIARMPALAAGAPLRTAGAALGHRLMEDRLALTASSLTYTTVLALVPLLTVVLSVFTLFPVFDDMEAALSEWLSASFIPASIAGNVMEYLTQFASQARNLGLVGIAALAVTALSLILTIDKTLNQIWRVSERRSLGARVLIYWALLTLGPIALSASIAMSSYVLSVSRGFLPVLPGAAEVLIVLSQVALSLASLTLLYRYVPHTSVRWRDAAAGALFVTLAMELARWGIGVYLTRNHNYSHIYGAFAVLPILLLWIYISWLIVLLGAAIAAYLPSLRSPVLARAGTPGWQFAIAVQTLRLLAKARTTPQRGLNRMEIAKVLRVDVLHLSPVLAALQQLDWVGRLEPGSRRYSGRYVLLADPEQESAQPLVNRFLMDPANVTNQAVRSRPLDTLLLAEVLGGTA